MFKWPKRRCIAQRRRFFTQSRSLRDTLTRRGKPSKNLREVHLKETKLSKIHSEVNLHKETMQSRIHSEVSLHRETMQSKILLEVHHKSHLTLSAVLTGIHLQWEKTSLRLHLQWRKVLRLPLTSHLQSWKKILKLLKFTKPQWNQSLTLTWEWNHQSQSTSWQLLRRKCGISN